MNNELPFFFGFRSLGNMFGYFFGGRIIQAFGNTFSFQVALGAPVLMFLFLFVFDEQFVDPDSKPRKEPKKDLVVIKQLLTR